MPLEIIMTSKTPKIESSRIYEVINDISSRINQFRGDEILDKWCKLTGVTYTIKDKMEDTEGRHIVTFQSDQFISTRYYDNIEDIPKDAIKCYGIQMHYVVECYVTVNGDETYIYKPIEGSRVEAKLLFESAESFAIHNGALVRVEEYNSGV
ncbi:hypothetical protein P9X10_01165 [Bacillus cereus]|nr:hypothetical protein [Bacillus cereus]